MGDSDLLYIADRRKKEFNYPLHTHTDFELNYIENASGVRRIVGDSSEVIDDYDLVLVTGPTWNTDGCKTRVRATAYTR